MNTYEFFAIFTIAGNCAAKLFYYLLFSNYYTQTVHFLPVYPLTMFLVLYPVIFSVKKPTPLFYLGFRLTCIVAGSTRSLTVRGLKGEKTYGSVVYTSVGKCAIFYLFYVH